MNRADRGLSEGAERAIYLGWRNGEGMYAPAVVGNGGQGELAMEQVIGSWEDFARGGGRDLADLLVSYGVDPVRNRVWAVINGNSAFVVIPELGCLAVLGATGVLAAGRRRNGHDEAN